MRIIQIILVIYGCFFAIHVLGFNIDPKIAAQMAIDEQLIEPEPDPDGRIQTLNQKGAMAPQIDKTSAAFIQHATQSNAKVLEIGAGYGLVCLEALTRGAKDYTANDMDIRHLKILAKKVKEACPSAMTDLKLNISEFPQKITEMEKEYDAILIARVLHFMRPEEADESIQTIKKLLKPGGKVYAVMLTPYVRGFSGFIPEFERKVLMGDPYPGFIKDLRSIADPSVVPERIRNNMKEHFLFFTAKTARDHFERNGLIIEKCEELPLAYHSEIWGLDGRENVGVIATRPK